MDIVQEIVCDLCDRDIIYIQLISFNKEQEQVKRTFELRQLYLVRSIIQYEKFKSLPKVQRLLWSISPENNKIPLQNNGTLAYYKNIILFKLCLETDTQLGT